MKKIIYIFYTLALSVVAVPALAAVTTFKKLVEDVLINGILQPIVPLLIGLAVVIFIYGVITLIFSEGGEKKEEGKQFMIWGIVGFFVMISMWGLVAILTNTFGLDVNTPAPPQVIIPAIFP